MRYKRLPVISRAVLSLTLLLPAVLGRAQSVPPLDSVMYRDPRLDLPESVDAFRDELKQTWITALRSDEADLKQEAAFALVWAAGHGMTGAEPAIEPLVANLSDERLSVRLSSARALTVLEARSAGVPLFERAQKDGLEMAQIVEPALARWEFPPIREVWRARLRDDSVSTASRLLAIRGLGKVRDPQAAAELQAMAIRADGDLVERLAAAEALPQIIDRGLEPLARQLIDRPSGTPVVERLIAARLLRHHSSDVTRELLVELARDDAPGVAAAALERLVEIDPDRILPLADSMLARGDSKVRRLVAQALLARPSSKSIRQLGDLLGDPHPGLRAFVGESLHELARSESWKADIIQQGARMIT
ncbi:MAG: hypothetical protein JJ992_25835, partial [Planctomycetes bacterium]|nr:hypothetical protein [Planctomycetota bacterium]